MSESLQVAIVLFDRFTALDAVGPYEVLQRIPTLDITFVGHKRGEVRCLLYTSEAGHVHGKLVVTVKTP